MASKPREQTPEQRAAAARRERTMLAHHATVAMGRDLRVTLHVGEGSITGFIVAMTNDHKPEVPDTVGPSTLSLRVSDEDTAELRVRHGHVPAGVIAAARPVPLERVEALRSVRG